MKPNPFTDLDVMPFGDHKGQLMRHVPALHLLSLIGTPELKKHPRVAAYIERAKRQLKSEAVKEHRLHD